MRDKDEQGKLWPPDDAPAVEIREYGGDSSHTLNGVTGLLGLYDRSSGLFEVWLPTGIDFWVDRGPGYIWCRANELVLLNDAANVLYEALTSQSVTYYDDQVYELRDKLAEVGVQVTAESVAAWTPEQFDRVWRYAAAVREPDHGPLNRPKELP